MSNDLNFDGQNPYAAPTQAGAPQQMMPERSIPGFSKVMFIIAIVFCVIRLLLVLLAIPGYAMLKQQGDPMVDTVFFEVGAGIAMVLFGLPANVLMLCKNKMGIILGYLYVLSVAASLCVGLWQASFVINTFPEGSPERIGAMMGGIIVTGIRLTLVGIYVAAIMSFSRWEQRRHEMH